MQSLKSMTYDELRAQHAAIIAARQEGPKALDAHEAAISAELTRRDIARMGSDALSNPEIQVHD